MPVGYKKCPRCGEEFRDDVEVCDNCGWVFYNKCCPRCGKYVPDSAKVCFDCGWHFYWNDHIGEDNQVRFHKHHNYKKGNDYTPPEHDYKDDYDDWDFWREIVSYYTDYEDLHDLTPQELGQILDDLGY
ncbi:MAG: zinc ribbon domain-containing protein [Fervidobacterium sp.]|uniref:DZANK-type domain-containing protein n=1 Tax=Fervidobacterium gondwanense DSM 13020 TaxID=1121883 RepID=A0A1M7TGH0_FERGO|nr:zinc ribbon domain-containing protein [Fervidobacterium gondwanense]SHN69842.1 hypothetical protein SAMN02745226_01977 [Fervidobacterium gondwanense DSM 13020]